MTTQILVPRAVVQSSTGDDRRVATHDPSLSVNHLATKLGDTSTLWWLGQAGFALRHRDGLLLIDPYLSDSLAAKYVGSVFPHVRLHEVPVVPEELTNVNLVLHTHAHTDHMDPRTISELLLHNQPTFVAPKARHDVALERHIPEKFLVDMDAGSTIEIGGVNLTALPAAHEVITVDDSGAHVFLGYVIEVDGVRIYHSGDCVPFDGQSDLLSDLDIDVALLPVNGRDEHRLANGVPGNFTVDEAVALCRAAGIPALICHHFGLFDFNTVNPVELSTRLGHIANGLEWTVPAIGAGFHLNPYERNRS